MTAAVEKALNSIHLLSSLPAECLRQIAAFSMLRSVRAGETIFCQGEPSPYCFGLVAGEVGIQRMPKDRRLPPKVLSVLGPGSIFGESSLFEDSPRAAMASARKDGQLVAILGAQLRQWARTDTVASVPLLMGLLQSTMGRLQRTSGDLSAVYGLGRLLGTADPLSEQLQAALSFIQNATPGAEVAAFYRRSAYWDEFEAMGGCPAGERYPTLPLVHPVAARLLTMENAFAMPNSEAPALFREFPATWQAASAIAAVPLRDQDRPEPYVQGFLLLASLEPGHVFSHHALLLLDSIGRQLSEALMRHRRQEEAAAQARLRASRNAFTL